MSTAGTERQRGQSVHYNCVCDEAVPLFCANESCRREVLPDSTLVVTPDGTVFCSDGCAQPL